MPQILPEDLVNYLICCPDGRDAPDYSRYLFESLLIAPVNRAEFIVNYAAGEFDSSTIESNFGVGIAGMQEVQISYIEDVIVTTENIFVDTTSSASFWADITGWLLLNNFYDIIYIALTDKWVINNPLNQSYIQIIKII